MNDSQGDPDRADPAAASRAGSSTAAQLRQEIDSGRTRDKVAHSDPAAAPLGTDDEAAGNSPSAEQVSAARRQESTRVSDTSPADQPDRTAAGGRFVWLIVAVVIICALVGIALSL